jgi:dipeptidyl aminopeptidase/acylaminoacyl peptidase
LFIGPPSTPAEYLPDRRFGDLQWSPRGRYLAVAQYAPLGEGTNAVAADLWVIDVSTGTSRLLYQPLRNHDSGAPLPNAVPWSSAYYASTLSIRSWSPDERYLTVGENLGGGNARGAELPFKVIDVATGAATSLGCETTLAWKSPHTLAYGCGDDRQLGSWSVLKTWSPERGVHQITADDETGMNPAWDPTGQYLYFTRSPKSQTVIPEDFFAGRGQGDRHIISLDTLTGDRRQLPTSMGYAEEAVITGTDGRLLVLRRILDPHYSTAFGASVRAEIWIYAKDGSTSALLSVPLPGMFPGFQRSVVWTRL